MADAILKSCSLTRPMRKSWISWMEGRMEAEEEGERVAGVGDMEEEGEKVAEAWDAEEEGDWMERDSDEDWG